MQDSSPKRRGDRAPEAEPGVGRSRRETRATGAGAACGQGGARGDRPSVADHGRGPYDHPDRATRVGRQGPDPRDSHAPSWWWPSASRKKTPDLIERLHEVMEGATAGDPTSSVKWTRKSTRLVARVLRISHTKAWRLLRAHKYHLRYNRKRLTRTASKDRERQFQRINRLKKSFARLGQPVISVDAKKRELVGLFKNQGRAWRRTPMDVDMYDFRSDAKGVAIPYGIYDLTR